MSMITRFQNGPKVVDVKYQGSTFSVDRGDTRTNLLRVGLGNTTYELGYDSRKDAQEAAEEYMEVLFAQGFENVDLPPVKRYNVRGPVAKLTAEAKS